MTPGWSPHDPGAKITAYVLPGSRSRPGLFGAISAVKRGDFFGVVCHWQLGHLVLFLRKHGILGRKKKRDFLLDLPENGGLPAVHGGFGEEHYFTPCNYGVALSADTGYKESAFRKWPWHTMTMIVLGFFWFHESHKSFRIWGLSVTRYKRFRWKSKDGIETSLTRRRKGDG